MSKSKKAGTDPRTLVTFLLDETGSMESIKDDTIGGINSYLGSLKAEAAPIDFTLIKFDSRRIEKVCVAVPVSQVAELTMESYQPGASTPLIDAQATGLHSSRIDLYRSAQFSQLHRLCSSISDKHFGSLVVNSRQ
jgi:hypothetical protein